MCSARRMIVAGCASDLIDNNQTRSDTMANAETEATKNEACKEKKIKSYDPAAIAISGGKMLADEEQGPLDTDVDIDDELYDPRLAKDLDEQFVRNVDAFGVHTPIKVRMRDGVPFVVFGRRRLRAARRVNRARIASGQPPLRIDATIEPSKDERRIMGVMYSENSARMNDGFTETVANLRRYMERGVSLDDAAMTFNLAPTKAKMWIDFDDNAIDIVRDYVHRDIMSVSAGIEIMRAGGPDEQRAALLTLLEDVGLVDAPTSVETFVGNGAAAQAAVDDAISKANTKIAAQKPDKRTGKTPAQAKLSARAARGAAKSVARPNANEGVADKRTQNRLLQAMRDMSHGKAGEKTIAFWEGAENMLTLVIGGDEGKETDVRLVELLKSVRKAMKAAK